MWWILILPLHATPCHFKWHATSSGVCHFKWRATLSGVCHFKCMARHFKCMACHFKWRADCAPLAFRMAYATSSRVPLRVACATLSGVLAVEPSRSE